MWLFAVAVVRSLFGSGHCTGRVERNWADGKDYKLGCCSPAFIVKLSSSKANRCVANHKSHLLMVDCSTFGGDDVEAVVAGVLGCCMSPLTAAFSFDLFCRN
jgi:hypothetical protein